METYTLRPISRKVLLLLALLTLFVAVAFGQKGSQCVIELNYCVGYPRSVFDSVQLVDEGREIRLQSSRTNLLATVSQLPVAIDYNFRDLYQREVNELALGATTYRELNSDISPDLFRAWLLVDDQRIYLQYQRIRDRVIALRMSGPNRMRAAIFEKVGESLDLYENVP